MWSLCAVQGSRASTASDHCTLCKQSVMAQRTPNILAEGKLIVGGAFVASAVSHPLRCIKD